MFALASTMQGLFPPSSSTAGVETFGGVAQHLFSNGLAAGEEDEVELLLEQRGVFRAPARDNGYVFGRKALRDNAFR